MKEKKENWKKMNKYKVIALCGKAGSGKNYLLNKLVAADSNLYPIVSYTTRPPREGEVEGKDYYFISKEEFANKVLNFEMLEAVEFNGWHYGTGYGSFSEDEINVGIFDPQGIEILMGYDNIDLIVYYIQATDKNRLMRQLQREENPNVREIIRRFNADDEDFYELDFATDWEYYTIENNTLEDAENAVDYILGQNRTIFLL